MIFDNSIDYDKQIRHLLTSSIMDERQADAFLKTEYNPSGMFIEIEEGELAACLQTHVREFSYRGKKAQAMVLDFFCAFKEQEKARPRLLEAALDKARNNCMIVLALSSRFEGLSSWGFGTISHQKAYLTRARAGKAPIGAQTEPWNRKDSLYPVYSRFMDHFDASIRLSESELESKLAEALLAGKRIEVHTSSKTEEMDGFAFFARVDGRPVIETVFYENPTALRELVESYQVLNNHVVLFTSGSENAGAILPVGGEIKSHDSLMALIPDLDAFSRWQNDSFFAFSDVFDKTELPSWNYLL